MTGDSSDKTRIDALDETPEEQAYFNECIRHEQPQRGTDASSGVIHGASGTVRAGRAARCMLSIVVKRRNARTAVTLIAIRIFRSSVIAVYR
jgi:hypothetical protein